MKDFLKYVFATVVGIMVVGLLSFIMMLVSLLGMTMQSTTTVPSNSVLVLKLNGEMVERTQDNPFAKLLSPSGSSDGVSLAETLKAIEVAKDNENVKGIYIESGTLMGGTPAMIEEIRAKLLDFKKSGKFILAYGDNYSQGTYYLSSVADSVVINPQGSIEWMGLSTTLLYFKDVLDKVGVKAEVFKVGTYKSAVEPYISNEMSDANREQISVYNGEIWKKYREDIAKSRKKLTADKLNALADSCLFLSDSSVFLKSGMVDKLAYSDEVKQMLARYMEVDSPNGYNTISVKDMANATNKAKDPSGNILAVYYATGEIVQEESTSSLLSTTQQIVGSKVIKDLEKLAEDDDVKAVVLRVNSPGGSAYASEQIWNQVMNIKSKKPIVVSMGGMAASGGYYISCPADWIVAEPTTITGSIGIFGLFFSGEELLGDKLGLKTYSVKTNEYSDLGSNVYGLMTRSMNANESKHIQSFINRGYELFTKRVADGRGKSQDYIKEIGEGRVWTGMHAKEIGLVDQLGGLDDAIAEAKKRAKLDACTVMSYPAEEDLFTKLMDTATSSDSYADARAKELFGETLEILTTMKSITSKDNMQASLPYVIKFNL